MIMDLIERNETMIRTLNELMTEKVFLLSTTKRSKPKSLRIKKARAVFFDKPSPGYESTIFLGSRGRVVVPGGRFWAADQGKTGRPANDVDD